MYCNRVPYISPDLELIDSEVWSGICAESVMSDTKFNLIMVEAQESGGEVDMSQDTFTHTWEDVE